MNIARCVALDLLICESHLRGRLGISLLSAIRGLYPLKAFALIATGSNEETSEAQPAGFDRLFLKPARFALHADVQEAFSEHAPESVEPLNSSTIDALSRAQ